jgi:hypothetical protein
MGTSAVFVKTPWKARLLYKVSFCSDRLLGRPYWGRIESNRISLATDPPPFLLLRGYGPLYAN